MRRRRGGRHPPRRSGDRRQRAWRFVQELDARVNAAAAALKAQPAELTQRIAQVQDQVKCAGEGTGRAEVEARVEPGRRTGWRRRSTSTASRCWRPRSTARTSKTLRETMDKLKDKLKSAAIVLASRRRRQGQPDRRRDGGRDRRRSRPASWSTSSRSRSAARAAAAPTWRRPAAPSRRAAGGAGRRCGLGRRTRVMSFVVRNGFLRT